MDLLRTIARHGQILALLRWRPTKSHEIALVVVGEERYQALMSNHDMEEAVHPQQRPFLEVGLVGVDIPRTFPGEDQMVADTLKPALVADLAAVGIQTFL